MSQSEAGLTIELYVTSVESESDQLSELLAVNNIRYEASSLLSFHGCSPFYVVYVAQEDMDRARTVRDRLFEQFRKEGK